MHVAVTGASGFIGTALVARLASEGHTVTRFVRRDPRSDDEARWDPGAGRIDAEALAAADGVVHLAGEPIAARRWSDQQKRRILDSRVEGTRLVAAGLADLADGAGGPRRVLVSASGIDYYGDRGDEVLTEDSGPGDEGFLPQVAIAWEAATDPARAAGVRVVHPRTGLVLSTDGGALPRLLRIFTLGLGGRLGSGRQHWPWISLDDEVGLIVHALVTDTLEGPVNAVSPNPVTNAEFTRTLARVLGRPAIVPVPPFGPALLLGRELARELLFGSKRALPEKALASGYAFRHEHLETCLRDLLDRSA